MKLVPFCEITKSYFNGYSFKISYEMCLCTPFQMKISYLFLLLHGTVKWYTWTLTQSPVDSESDSLLFTGITKSENAKPIFKISFINFSQNYETVRYEVLSQNGSPVCSSFVLVIALDMHLQDTTDALPCHIHLPVCL